MQSSSPANSFPGVIIQELIAEMGASCNDGRWADLLRDSHAAIAVLNANAQESQLVLLEDKEEGVISGFEALPDCKLSELEVTELNFRLAMSYYFFMIAQINFLNTKESAKARKNYYKIVKRMEPHLSADNCFILAVQNKQLANIISDTDHKVLAYVDSIMMMVKALDAGLNESKEACIASIKQSYLALIDIFVLLKKPNKLAALLETAEGNLYVPESIKTSILDAIDTMSIDTLEDAHIEKLIDIYFKSLVAYKDAYTDAMIYAYKQESLLCLLAKKDSRLQAIAPSESKSNEVLSPREQTSGPRKVSHDDLFKAYEVLSSACGTKQFQSALYDIFHCYVDYVDELVLSPRVRKCYFKLASVTLDYLDPTRLHNTGIALASAFCLYKFQEQNETDEKKLEDLALLFQGIKVALLAKNPDKTIIHALKECIKTLHSVSLMGGALAILNFYQEIAKKFAVLSVMYYPILLDSFNQNARYVLDNIFIRTTKKQKMHPLEQECRNLIAKTYREILPISELHMPKAPEVKTARSIINRFDVWKVDRNTTIELNGPPTKVPLYSATNGEKLFELDMQFMSGSQSGATVTLSDPVEDAKQWSLLDKNPESIGKALKARLDHISAEQKHKPATKPKAIEKELPTFLLFTQEIKKTHPDLSQDSLELFDEYFRTVVKKNEEGRFVDSAESLEVNIKAIYRERSTSKPVRFPSEDVFTLANFAELNLMVPIERAVFSFVKRKHEKILADIDALKKPVTEVVLEIAPVIKSPVYVDEPEPETKREHPKKASRRELNQQKFDSRKAEKEAAILKQKEAEREAREAKKRQEEESKKHKQEHQARKQKEKEEREKILKIEAEKEKKIELEIANAVTQKQKDCLDQTFLKLWQFKELQARKVQGECLAEDQKPSANDERTLLPVTRHYAAIYCFLRCFELMKAYKQESYKNTMIKAKFETSKEKKLYSDLSFLRNQIIHRGAEVLSTEDVEKLSVDILKMIPQKFLGTQNRSKDKEAVNYWKCSLTESQRKDWICEFGYGSYQYQFKEYQLSLENTDLYKTLEKFYHDPGEKAVEATALEKMVMTDILPKILEIIESVDVKKLGLTAFRDSHLKTPDLFVHQYFFEMQAIRMLVTMCGELSNQFKACDNKVLKSFIEYCRLVRNETGHEVDDFKSVHKPDIHFFTEVRARLHYINRPEIALTALRTPVSKLNVAAKEFTPVAMPTVPNRPTISVPVESLQNLPVYYQTTGYQQMGFYGNTPTIPFPVAHGQPGYRGVYPTNK